MGGNKKYVDGGKNVKIKRTKNILYHFSPLIGEKKTKIILEGGKYE